MMTFISRSVGVIVVVGLALVGADALIQQIAMWKNTYDRLGFKGVTITDPS